METNFLSQKAFTDQLGKDGLFNNWLSMWEKKINLIPTLRHTQISVPARFKT